jgi:hypothetical protein
MTSLRALLLLVTLGLVACSTTTPPRIPSAYQPVTTSRILDDPDFPPTRTLPDAQRVDVSGTEAEMAQGFAERIDRATKTCSVRKISHAPGSPEVSVDLGLGCRAGAGALKVRFSKIDEGAAVAFFSFRDFYQDGNFLDGDVSGETSDGQRFSFGKMPWKPLDPPSIWSPPSAASTSGVRVGSALAAFLGEMFFRMLLVPLQLMW